MTTDPSLPGEVHAAMCAFVNATRGRRSVTPVLHVGRPAEHRRILDADWYDPAARADLLTRALDGVAAPEALVWRGRGGDPTPEYGDVAWLAAADVAHARHGLTLKHFFVVTRHGWADLVAGEQHRWHRVRPERHAC